MANEKRRPLFLSPRLDRARRASQVPSGRSSTTSDVEAADQRRRLAWTRRRRSPTHRTRPLRHLPISVGGPQSQDTKVGGRHCRIGGTCRPVANESRRLPRLENPARSCRQNRLPLSLVCPIVTSERLPSRSVIRPNKAERSTPGFAPTDGTGSSAATTSNNSPPAGPQALDQITQAVVATLREAFGIGPDCAAEMMIVAGNNPGRIRSESAFAKLDWFLSNSSIIRCD